MTHPILIALAMSVAPMAALALPQLGDVVGTNPTSVSTALKTSGCMVTSFYTEGGRHEAKCRESAGGKTWEVYIDPTSGAVVHIKDSD